MEIKQLVVRRIRIRSPAACESVFKVQINMTFCLLPVKIRTRHHFERDILKQKDSKKH